MSKKVILAGVALFALVISSLLLTGCPWQAASLYGIKVAGDGNGGAFAVYENELGGLIYAQKIGPDGKAVWEDKGVRLVESDSQFYTFPFIQIISDGSGGAIATMPSSPSSLEPEDNYYVFKIGSQGQADFLTSDARIDQIISDGSGGVIFDYSPNEATIYVNKVDSKGDFPWGNDGVVLRYSGNSRQIASDGFGGAVIAREDLRYPEDAQPGETFSRHHIYAQKIDYEGNLSWGEEGILFYSTSEDVFSESMQITDDGSGGAIIAWHQQPRGRIESGSVKALGMDIFVQRIDTDGNVLWLEGGLPLEINKAATEAFPIEPRLVSDGSGGAIVIWRDAREGTGVYAQRIKADGTISWQAGGVKVSSTPLNPFPMIVSDGAGGAIVSYVLEEGLYVQRLNGNGERVWPENGIRVIDGEYQGCSIAPDGQGGVIVGWGVGKGMFSSEKAYTQRVSTDGKLLWGEDGLRLNP
ncbi:MAG: hypothetical protein PHQ43_13535 [Dehalococcoidales bacterium]|nr:hypothetical protein [Dehalococcoidales bacterium]